MTASRPGTVLQLGPGHGLTLKFGASLSISRPLSLTYERKGLESPSQSVILRTTDRSGGASPGSPG